MSFRIIYPVIQMATQSGRNVYVTITKDSGDSVVLLFKFISPSAANGLYRAITEIHAFYRWILLWFYQTYFSKEISEEKTILQPGLRFPKAS